VTDENEQGGEQPDERTPFVLRYTGQSELREEHGRARIELHADADRTAAVGFEGVLRDPLHVRELLSVVHDVVKSDFRYVPRDRTAYLAFKRRQGGAGASAFQAQRAYFDWLARNDPNAWIVLDPIVTAHPDGLMFEVFSKDEGSYCRLDLPWEELDLDEEPTFGTTNVDFSSALFDGVQQMRSYRSTRMAMSAEAFGVSTDDGDEVIVKRINVPNSWLRGFLQVQAAATLPKTRVQLAQIDLYNVLRHLRLNADQKRGGRAIRVELMPGMRPRIVLEPWEVVFETHGAVYEGNQARVVRIWGRRRLMLLRRIIGLVDTVDLHLLGTGMPSFWVFHCGPATITLGLTGFTSSNWSQAVQLDLMLPRPTEESAATAAVLDALAERWFASVDQLAEDTGAEASEVVEALQVGAREGRVVYDVDGDLYRYRPLTDEPLDLDRFAFRNLRERTAHDLVAGRGGGVTIDSEEEIPGRGTEFVGTIEVTADRREYRTSFLLTEEGRAYEAECSCAHFRQHQLKEGFCPHIVALRVAVGEQARRRAEDGGPVTIETRTYVRRHAAGEDVYRVSLDRRQLRVRWGLRSQTRKRSQRLMFNSLDEARDAYLARIADLEARGFMDATAEVTR